MGGNDLFFAGLQGVIEIVRQDDVGSNDFAVAERGDELRRQIHEHEAPSRLAKGHARQGEGEVRRADSG
jgi:hypothetical protein